MAEEAKVKVTDASGELEDMARAAAHANFAEWHKQERGSAASTHTHVHPCCRLDHRRYLS